MPKGEKVSSGICIHVLACIFICSFGFALVYVELYLLMWVDLGYLLYEKLNYCKSDYGFRSSVSFFGCIYMIEMT